MTELTGMSVLTKAVVGDRIKGYTFEEIASRIDISTEEVVLEWKKYVASRAEMPKEEQWVLMLLRLESLLTQAHAKLQYSTELSDFDTLLNILDRIEQLQSLNLSRKEVAQAEAEKMYQLQASQLLSILEMSKLMMTGMIEEAFQKHKTLKAAKANLLEDLGELPDKALEQLGAVSE